MAVVYVVDDDPQICKTTQIILESEGWSVRTFDSAESCREAFASTEPDVVIADYHLPGKSGLDLLETIHHESPEVEVIIITGVGDEETAIQAMQRGARDYLRKPINFKELLLVVRRALEQKRVGEKLNYLYEQQRRLLGFGHMVGRSPEMQSVFKMIRMVSESHDTSVMISGETGTGKEVVARTIHDSSDRSREPFVEVNCAAIPLTLLESELFGHEKGAFTDARTTKVGLMEQADGGTFFMDEVASMDLSLQVKLLKAIEEKKVRRLGGVVDIPIDVRIIGSTSRPLLQLVEEDKFREDLFYRLNVFSIELPPLRTRGEDVLLLADYFLERFNSDLNCEVDGFSSAAKGQLMDYTWPGNVRELRNVVERAVLQKKSGSIERHHLVMLLDTTDDQYAKYNGYQRIYIPETGIKLDEVIKNYLEAALRQAGGNKSRAAKLLGISRSAFRYRLEKYLQE